MLFVQGDGSWLPSSFGVIQQSFNALITLHSKTTFFPFSVCYGIRWNISKEIWQVCRVRVIIHKIADIQDHVQQPTTHDSSWVAPPPNFSLRRQKVEQVWSILPALELLPLNCSRRRQTGSRTFIFVVGVIPFVAFDTNVCAIMQLERKLH